MLEAVRSSAQLEAVEQWSVKSTRDNLEMIRQLPSTAILATRIRSVIDPLRWVAGSGFGLTTSSPTSGDVSRNNSNKSKVERNSQSKERDVEGIHQVEVAGGESTSVQQ